MSTMPIVRSSRRPSRRVMPVLVPAFLAMVAGPSALLSPALAQNAPDAAASATQPSSPDRDRAIALFERAGEAMAEAQPLVGSFRQWIEGSEQLAGAMGGDLTGTIMMMLPEPEAEGAPQVRDRNMGSEWVIRVNGLGRLSPRDTGPTNFDYALYPEKSVWVDHENKKVIERSPSAAFRGSTVLTAAQMLDLPELRARDAFEIVKSADSFVFEDRQELEGIVCEVVLVTHNPDTVGRPGSRSAARPFSQRQTRYFIGVDDGLVRRVDRVGDFGAGLRLSLNMQFADLGPDETLTEADLEVETPDGYERDVSPTVRSTDAIRTRGAGEPSGAVATDTPVDTAPRPTVTLPMAPEFSVSDGAGGQITLADLKGAPSVLYWWGTWCIPCRQVSPLVSGLVEEYKDRGVRVIGMATRESDPQAPADYIADNNYAFSLALADNDTASKFRVRAYPSIYVLNAKGEIAKVANPAAMRDVPRDEQPAALMREIRAALDEILAAG